MDSRTPIRVVALCLAGILAFGQPPMVCAVVCILGRHDGGHHMESVAGESDGAPVRVPCHAAFTVHGVATSGSFARVVPPLPIVVPSAASVVVGELFSEVLPMPSVIASVETPPPRRS